MTPTQPSQSDTIVSFYLHPLAWLLPEKNQIARWSWEAAVIFFSTRAVIQMTLFAIG